MRASHIVVKQLFNLTEQDALGGGGMGEVQGITLEGLWEDVVSQGSALAGQRVRVTVIPEPAQSTTNPAQENRAMLAALRTIRELHEGMNPKQDRADYLREAREGALYDLND